MQLAVADWKELQRLEEALLWPDVRRSPEAMAVLLAEDFRAFGQSGRVYDKATILATVAQSDEAQLSLMQCAATALAPAVVLVTSQSTQRAASGKARQALRSSMWRRTEQGWELVCHQGTPVASAP